MTAPHPRLSFAVIFLASSLLGPGCAATLGRVDLLDKEQLAALPTNADDDERFGKASAAALLWHDRYAVETPTRAPIQTLFQHHRVLLIRNQEAIDRHGSVRIVLDENEEIDHFRARTISASGEVTPVDPNHVFDDEVRFGKRGERIRRTSARVRSFRFPRVEVGSLLELTYTTRLRGYYPTLTSMPPRNMYVVDYEMELLTSRHVEVEVRLHNADQRFQKEKAGTKTRIRLALRDIPMEETHDFTPHWSKRRPFWEARVRRFLWRHEYSPVTQTWRDTYRSFAERLYTRDKAFFDGFDLDVPAADCGEDVRCKATRAVVLVRERAELGSLANNFYEVRPAGEVLAEGRANSFEKAVLLFGALEDRGIDARFALLPRRFGRKVDKRAPSHRVMSHIVLYLPKQRGLQDELWIDPSCEWCSLGELPDWSRDMETLVIGFEEKAFQRKEGLAEWRVARGKPAPPTRQLHRYDARLKQNGDLHVALHVEDFGAHAWRRRRNTRGDSEAKALERAERRVREALSTARLVDFDPPRCDRARGHCVHRYEYVLPGFATQDGGEWLFPLSVVTSFYDRRLTRKKRHHDIVAEEADEIVSELKVSLPAGLELERRVQRAPVESALGRYGFEMELTPDGFRARRALVILPGAHPKERYEDLRRPLEASRDTRSIVLTLVPAAPHKAE